MRLRSLVLLTLGLGVLCGGVATAKSVLRWKLAIQPDDSVRNPAGRLAITPPRGGEQVYWFVVYSVTSSHDADIPLMLHARARTDATADAVSEGYYPRALAQIRKKYGDDVLDSVSAAGHVLKPGETVRVASVFQFRNKDGGFNDAVDTMTVQIEGYCDPVKKDGLEFQREDREYWMTFKRKGDAVDAWKESLKYAGSEEKIVSPSP